MLCLLVGHLNTINEICGRRRSLVFILYIVKKKIRGLSGNTVIMICLYQYIMSSNDLSELSESFKLNGRDISTLIVSGT